MIYVQLTVTCSSRTHTEFIFVLPLHQWLPEIILILHNTYIAYVVNL